MRHGVDCMMEMQDLLEPLQQEQRRVVMALCLERIHMILTPFARTNLVLRASQEIWSEDEVAQVATLKEVQALLGRLHDDVLDDFWPASLQATKGALRALLSDGDPYQLAKALFDGACCLYFKGNQTHVFEEVDVFLTLLREVGEAKAPGNREQFAHFLEASWHVEFREYSNAYLSYGPEY